MGHYSDNPFTRGGQMTYHGWRMWARTLKPLLYLACVVALVIFLGLSWVSVPPYSRYLMEQYALLQFQDSLRLDFLPDTTPPTPIYKPNGQVAWVRLATLEHWPYFQSIYRGVQRALLRSLVVGVVLGTACFFAAYIFLRRRGTAQAKQDYIQGDQLASVAVVKALLVKRGRSQPSRRPRLLLGSLPLLPAMECSHFLFHGTTGTGKSTAIKSLLDQIRMRGDRAIIYDKSCNYLEEFYLPAQDVLLNPLDARGESWDLWAECRDAADFDSLAAAQIPMPTGIPDPFWIQAARILFSTAAFEMEKDPARSVSKLLDFLLNAESDQLQQYLRRTAAAPLLSEKMGKVTASIKSVLATYLKSLQYLQSSPTPFSIRQWIADEEASHWLFMTSLGDRHETLKPLISCWLDTAVNALLSLPPNPHRRIWLILDELSSLQPLPYLTQALSEARKFGGCIVVGVQNYAQLAKVYSSDGAQEISSLLNTRVVFRQPDPKIAQWSALNLGEALQQEWREGFSYGARAGGDGLSTHRLHTKEPVVSFSDILRLRNLEAYVRLPEDYPLTKVTFGYTARHRPNVPFLMRQAAESFFAIEG